MPQQIESLKTLGALPFDDVIDVRSPSEFAEDHIPGAISLPVLSDAERAEVGTIYVQQDPFRARKIGAALVARNAAAHLQDALADRTGGWRPLVYCWRGGQRSGAFASILSQVGWRADTIAGGYKSYRRLVVRMLYDDPLPHQLVLIDGNTGTAKTRLLELAAGAGAQVIDLEGLAAHRGSLFGALPGGQPTQKMFETRLAAALGRLDPARPVLVEAESARIGQRMIPPALWQAMVRGAHIRVTAPPAARAEFLTRAYADLTGDAARLAARIDRLRPYHAAARIDGWHALAAAGDFRALAQELMGAHYDPRYKPHPATDRPPLVQLDLPSLDEAALAGAVPHILAALDRLRQ